MTTGTSDFPDFVKASHYGQLLNLKEQWAEKENEKRKWMKKFEEEKEKDEEDRDHSLHKIQEGIRNLNRDQNTIVRHAQKLSVL